MLYKIKPLVFIHYGLAHNIEAYQATVKSMAVYTIEWSMVEENWHIYFNNGYSVVSVGAHNHALSAMAMAQSHWQNWIENALTKVEKNE